MSKIWSYIAIFFAGAFSAMAMVFFKQKPQTVINAESYIAEQQQKVGKIKQKGEGNLQSVELEQTLSKKEIRKARRAARKAKRQQKKSVLSPDDDNSELSSN